jgi:hypothetical protein
VVPDIGVVIHGARCGGALVIPPVAGGKMVALRDLVRAAVRIAAAGLITASITASAGCFYVEPINQRPALDIRRVSSESVFRGGTVTLEAVASDPEQHVVAFQWRVYACTDATSVQDCDLADPVFTGVEPAATFVVPPFRIDPDGDGPRLAPPVESLRVVLEGKDDHGAAARPDQELVLTVENALPSLALRVASVHGAVVTTPIEVYARYGDADDMPANVTLSWTVFSPSQVPGTLSDLAVPPDGAPGQLQQGKSFTPQVTGNWDVVVVATDRAGGEATARLTVTVVPDGPPCLGLWSPAAAAAPLPIAQPTLFQVAQVRDDLDPFPRTQAAPFIGDPELVWSIKVAGGPREVLAHPLNTLAFDPEVYAPGTEVELRVEVFDRNRTAITCADELQTCSVISQDSCIQRQTWRVEAR